jgi:tRNA G37 N-methylase Trm5
MIYHFKKIIEYLLDMCLQKSISFQDYINARNTRFGDYKFKPMDENITIHQVLSEYRFDDIQKDDIVLDIGANVGGFCMLISNSVKQVYAVEPLFTDVLKENIKNNNVKNINVYEVGLGLNALNCTFSSRKKKIECVSLSELIKMCGGKVDFLKCDCECGEWCIQPHELDGIRRIEMELHSFNGEKLTDFSNMLIDCGYEICITDNNGGTMIVHATLNEGSVS